MMYWRGWRILAAVGWAFWMLVVVPGHRRGIIQFSCCMDSAAADVCPLCAANAGKPAPVSTPSGPTRPAAPVTCAVCSTVAMYGMTPAVVVPVFTPQFAEFGELACVVRPVEHRLAADAGCRDPPGPV